MKVFLHARYVGIGNVRLIQILDEKCQAAVKQDKKVQFAFPPRMATSRLSSKIILCSVSTVQSAAELDVVSNLSKKTTGIEAVYKGNEYGAPVAMTRTRISNYSSSFRLI